MRKRFWKDFWWDLLAHPRVLMLLALGLPALSFLAPWAATALLITGLTFAGLAVIGTGLYLAATGHVKKKQHGEVYSALTYLTLGVLSEVGPWMKKNPAKGAAAVIAFLALVVALTLTMGYIADPMGIFSFMAPVFSNLGTMFAAPLNLLGIPIPADIMVAIYFTLAVLMIFDTIREMLPYGGDPLQINLDDDLDLYSDDYEYSASDLVEHNHLIAPSVGVLLAGNASIVDYALYYFSGNGFWKGKDVVKATDVCYNPLGADGERTIAELLTPVYRPTVYHI